MFPNRIYKAQSSSNGSQPFPLRTTSCLCTRLLGINASYATLPPACLGSDTRPYANPTWDLTLDPTLDRSGADENGSRATRRSSKGLPHALDRVPRWPAIGMHSFPGVTTLNLPLREGGKWGGKRKGRRTRRRGSKEGGGGAENWENGPAPAG